MNRIVGMPFRGSMKRTACILATTFLCLPIVADAGDVKPWSGKHTVVPAKMEAPQFNRFMKNEGYFETFLVMMYAKGGTWIQTRFILTNVGPGDGHGAVDVMRYGSTFDEPKKRSFSRYIDKVEAKARTLSSTGQPLNLAFRNTSLKKTKRGYLLTVRARGYELEVELKSVGPLWKPGNGEAKFPSGGRFGVHLMPSLATFSGRERYKNGEWKEIRGSAWGEHGYTNMMANVLSDRFLRFHGRRGRYAISFLELFTPEHFAKERLGYLLVTKGKQVVASSLSARATPTTLKTDPKKPHHKVPFNYRIVGKTDEGETLSVDVKVGRTLAREDVLGTVPKWVQRVIKVFIQPINYFNRARFSIMLPEGKAVKGSGVSLYSPMKAKL